MYCDGRDLQHLNVKQVRRKIGADPQAVQLHPQDPRDNIVAHHGGATSEEAWGAAAAAICLGSTPAAWSARADLRISKTVGVMGGSSHSNLRTATTKPPPATAVRGESTATRNVGQNRRATGAAT